MSGQIQLQLVHATVHNILFSIPRLTYQNFHVYFFFLILDVLFPHVLTNTSEFLLPFLVSNLCCSLLLLRSDQHIRILLYLKSLKCGPQLRLAFSPAKLQLKSIQLSMTSVTMRLRIKLALHFTEFQSHELLNRSLTQRLSPTITSSLLRRLPSPGSLSMLPPITLVSIPFPPFTRPGQSPLRVQGAQRPITPTISHYNTTSTRESITAPPITLCNTRSLHL